MMAGGLPGPAPAPALFATHFTDASNDPTQGQPQLLVQPFVHDLITVGNNTSTATLRDRIALAGHRRHAVAMIILSRGAAQTYLFPHRFEGGIMGANPELDGKFFAFHGELVGNQGHTVEIPSDVFDLLRNTVLVHDVPTIKAYLAANAAEMWMDPPTAGDAGTLQIKTRKIVPLPHNVVGLFLARGMPGVTPRFYFDTILPVLENEGLADDCSALTQVMQLAIMRTTPGTNTSVVEVATLPAAVSYNETLFKYQQDTLQFIFPQLSPRTGMQTTNILAQGLGVLATQQDEHHKLLVEEKKEAKENPVKKWLGPVRFAKLCKLLCVADEADLKLKCPVWHDMAISPKSFRIEVLQDKITEAFEETNPSIKSRATAFVITQAQFDLIIGLVWANTTHDTVTSGIMSNPFATGLGNADRQREINAVVRTMGEGGMDATKSEVEQLLKLAVAPPAPDKSYINIRNLLLLYKSVIPETHNGRIFLQSHLTSWMDFREDWESYQTQQQDLQPAKDVLHCQYIHIRLNNFWRDQGSSSTAVVMAAGPNDIITRISEDELWEPRISSTLHRALKLDTHMSIYSHLQRQQGRLPPMQQQFRQLFMGTQDEGSVGSQSVQSFLSALDGGSLGAASRASNRSVRFQGVPPNIGGTSTTGAGGASRGGGGDTVGTSLGGSLSNPQSGRNNVDNSAYDPIFHEFKERKDANNRRVRSKDIRDEIAAGNLPPLPLSKYDHQQPMCLAWHSKGVCNRDCPRREDHKSYATEEYKAAGGLWTWCSANYPGGSPPGE